MQDQASILVYIDPKGNGDGSLENPLGTLEQARDKVRELRLAGEMRNIDIILNDGTYELEKTFILNLSDSAPEGSFTRYIAAKNSNPIISGGVNVLGWEKTGLQKGNIWSRKAAQLGNISKMGSILKRGFKLYHFMEKTANQALRH